MSRPLPQITDTLARPRAPLTLGLLLFAAYSSAACASACFPLSGRRSACIQETMQLSASYGSRPWYESLLLYPNYSAFRLVLVLSCPSTNLASADIGVDCLGSLTAAKAAAGSVRLEQCGKTHIPDGVRTLWSRKTEVWQPKCGRAGVWCSKNAGERKAQSRQEMCRKSSRRAAALSWALFA
ncbi:uncharacterized protein BJ171DRAFT_503131 [Polychytrium aggregatum]|uniref:uncharacterized protein n=1 Tax=Polychytrium aggregatum TaxID=110093 RepID=UPI0022FF368C|nr:uncharacterized protein BJ171DRAFT_542123 [Polychytrium aggregatum]XP_052967234.1 uncharacterized protein BJ171DRAFT_503131 [Polychytrium aggregatum]KAI9190708.1 hypothetical protein BJ171DRAFT_542123 [Polychytrium aggregatum]KAI9205154.1 hypothetical protein BJ171DRAFT_503131 [Polychytrium aggregatum]